jgi:methanethiol S-methyltransferase
LAGLALSFLSVMRFGALGFLGFQREAQGRLVRDGVHGRIRHPIYTGIIMAALGWVLLWPTVPVIISVLITFIYLPIGIQLEEQKLIGQFGEEYIRYRSEVPALVPSGKRAERKKPTS